MDLSIIIVSYNAKDHLHNCLLSLYRHAPRASHEIIVVDNQSTDGSPEMIEKKFPDVILLRNDQNQGFSKANNRGYRNSRGAHLLFLNSDTLVLRDALDKMISFQKSHRQAGIIGPKILNRKGCPTRSYMRFVDIKTLYLGSRRLGKLINASSHRLHYASYDYRTVRRVPWVSGACMLVKQAVFEKTKRFDENYFLYLEDMDLCLQSHRLGFETIYLPSAAVVHFFGKSTCWDENRLQRIRNQSLVYFFKKNYSFPALLSAYAYIWLFGGLR